MMQRQSSCRFRDTSRHLLLALVFVLLPAIYATAQRAPKQLLTWGDATWQLQLDSASGALVRIQNRHDPHHMNWLREAGHWKGRDWVADTAAITQDGQWGLVETNAAGLLHVAKLRQVAERAWEAVYTSATLTVTVRRELTASGELTERYTFTNTGFIALSLPLGRLAITAPLFDQYPDAGLSLVARCHSHLWMGGSSAWINAQRMGTAAPHLGLVLTEGSLDAYSQRGGTYNDRGLLLLHPAAIWLEPGKSTSVGWTLFWHQGWDSFFSRVGAAPGFVRLTAAAYTVPVGQSLQVTATAATALDKAQVLVGGVAVPAQVRGNQLSATIPTTKHGELLVELRLDGHRTWLRANVVAASDELLAARVRFIVRRQQRNAPGDPLDGAYLSYDNETGEQVYNPKWNDHNAGRERVAMGVLGALYLPQCRDEAFRAELRTSLTRYDAFLQRELEDEEGTVYALVGRKESWRLYNFPWVAHFHLAMYQATGEAAQLDRFVRVMRSYYKHEGQKHYSIGIPVAEGLQTLRKAGRGAEYAELLGYFKAQAAYILERGANYPRSEVNYEQSIVAPAVQLLAELYTVTGDKAYLAGARQQLPLLEAFAGQQPDFRLYEVAIRHWDDYWFGKLHLHGDTMPHYWSALNAGAYAYYGRSTGDPSWLRRADAVLQANLSLFRPDGSATCAHLYPLTVDGQPGARDDPWANDQDWALVQLLAVQALAKRK